MSAGCVVVAFCQSSTLSANAGTPAIGGPCRKAAQKGSRFCYWHRRVREVHGHTCTAVDWTRCLHCGKKCAVPECHRTVPPTRGVWCEPHGQAAADSSGE